MHILPFIDEGELYKQFHLDEAWDSSHNRKLIARMPAEYLCPDHKAIEPGKTTYLGPVGKNLRSQPEDPKTPLAVGTGGIGTMFTGDAQGLRFPADIADGIANTIFVVDADDDHAVPWTKPDDLQYDPQKPLAGLIGHHGDHFQVLMADGSVRSFARDVSPATIRALMTRNGGEIVNLPVQPAPRRGSDFRGLPWLEGPELNELQVAQFLRKGLGNQVGLHACDAPPLFDFNLPGFLGQTLGMRGGRSPFGQVGEEGLAIGFVVASLNAPVYISWPVRDRKIVDEFLNRLDLLLTRLGRQRQNLAPGLVLEQDFYHLPLDRDRALRCCALSIGPVKWRFFWARIGDGLYLASKAFILEDLLAGRTNPTSPQPAAGGAPAHGMVRLRPQNWNQVLADYRLAWAENNRVACLHNLGPLSSVGRAVDARSEDGERQLNHLTEKFYGVRFFCPEGGRYLVSPDGKNVTCTIHGSGQSSRQPAAPTGKSPSSRLLNELTGLTTTLQFLEDGLHAVMTIDRQ